jgi:hypothetical protein
MNNLGFFIKKERIMNFSWRDSRNKTKLDVFARELARSYISLTVTTRLKESDLIGVGKTDFYFSTTDFINAVQKEEVNYVPSQSQWGYTYFETQHHFIDLSKIQKQAKTEGGSAGQAILDACWHEWGHSDIESRTQGDLLNNKIGFYSPISKTNEPWIRYRGAEVYTQTYYGLLRFEEVLNETITVRRMIEQLKLESIVSAKDYYLNGVDFFPKLTSVIGISLEEIYQLHATSNFEELAKIIGEKLPGNKNPIEKGLNLFIGIHESDKNIINNTGALGLLTK